MKIKLELLDQDKNYISRISSAFTNKYADKLEVYSFSVLENAMESLTSSKIDVFLAAEDFEIDLEKLPARCGFAYITDSVDVESMNGVRAISKYQRPDVLYKQIIDIYSENTSIVTGYKHSDGTITKIMSFVSASGGVGSSTVAAAFAIKAAKNGKRVLYINLEEFGDCNSFFSGDSVSDLSDIIYVLKSKKTNLALKLESSVVKDPSGVMFYKSPKLVLDLLELGLDELKNLINVFQTAGGYDYIVFDVDIRFNEKCYEIFSISDKVIFVNDGGEISNLKLLSCLKTLAILDEQQKVDVIGKLLLIYNKFSSSQPKNIEEYDIKPIGGIPFIKNAACKQIVEHIAGLDVFEELLKEGEDAYEI